MSTNNFILKDSIKILNTIFIRIICISPIIFINSMFFFLEELSYKLLYQMID